MDFAKWFIDEMDKTGYKPLTSSFSDLGDWVQFNHKITPSNFTLVYIKHPCSVDVVKDFFSLHANPLLFVVDSRLVDSSTMDGHWLRAIHALYYGRVYAWNGQNLIAIHHDRIEGRNQVHGPIDVTSIYFDTVDSWYKGMPGTYKTARFNDPNFWKAEEPKQRREHKKKVPNDTENFWRDEYERQKRSNPNRSQRPEDVYEALRQAFNEYQRQSEANNPPPPQRSSYRPVGDKWFNLLIAEGTLDGAKKKYRQLALENHPDRKGDSPEVIEVMQLINAAWARVKEILV